MLSAIESLLVEGTVRCFSIKPESLGVEGCEKDKHKEGQGLTVSAVDGGCRPVDAKIAKKLCMRERTGRAPDIMV